MSEKTCTKCGVVKPLTEFSERPSRPNGYRSRCKSCEASSTRNNYKVNMDYNAKQKEWSKTSYKNLKAAVIAAYGGMCVCCGETEPRFLTIDHADGSGADSRRAGEGLGCSLYLRLKREGFPKGTYQLLCFNCNCSKSQFGVCPHRLATSALITQGCDQVSS